MIFVTGTDTGVGKTWVSVGVVRHLRARGVDVGVMKPFESGCARSPNGQLVPADATALQEAAGVADPLELICPVRFELPLAPGVAAGREGRVVAFEAVEGPFRSLRERHRVLVVEGAGGLLVPACGDLTMAEVAKRLGLPLLIVARASLGTINHTLLTIEAARARGLEVRGVVLNHGLDGTTDDPSVSDNAQIIARLGQVPVFGPLPRTTQVDSSVGRHEALQVDVRTAQTTQVDDRDGRTTQVDFSAIAALL